MTAQDDVTEVLKDMVRSLETSYDNDRMTPGFMYRKDTRSTFHGEDFAPVVNPAFGLVRVKLSVEKGEITPTDAARLMFYAGYYRLFATDSHISPAEFLVSKLGSEAPAELTADYPDFHQKMSRILDKVMANDGDLTKIHIHGMSGATVWGWALGKRFGEYRKSLAELNSHLEEPA